MQILDYFCTGSQAAELLGVNRITIWRWIKSGKFNIQRVSNVVFIPKDELELTKESKNKSE